MILTSRWIVGVCLSLVALIAVMAVGCNKAEDKTAQTSDKGGETEGHGWWCAEHGMPEADCAQCNPKLAAKLKKEGDWCKEHYRPESQCVICHPELKETYAAAYRAKYGKEPPPIKE